MFTLRIRINHLLLTLLVSSFALPVSGVSAKAAAPQPAGQDSAKSEQKAEDFGAEFDKVWQTVRDRFWDRNLSGLDWKKIGDSYKAQLPTVKTKTAFQKLINKMLEELHASHTTYATDDDYEFYMLPEVMQRDMDGHQVTHIGVTGREVPGGYEVAAVVDNGPAQKAGIRTGDIILSADGAPFKTAGSFKGKEGKQVQISLIRSGATQSITVTPVKQNMLMAFLDGTRYSARIIEYQGKKLGYVHLWTMANDSFQAVLNDLVQNKLHDTDGLILDLRDGFGGSPYGYADVFCRPDVAWETIGRGRGGSVSHQGYNKPIAALINAGTRSAKEYFSYQLKTSHRAILVGKQTAGAFLGAGAFNISNYGTLELAILGLKVDGKRLEANGVMPDIAVEASNSYSDKDSQVAAAEQQLMVQIQSDHKPDVRVRVNAP